MIAGRTTRSLSRAALVAAIAVSMAFVGALIGAIGGFAALSAQSGQTPTVQGMRFENNWPNSVSVSALLDQTDGRGDEIDSVTFLYTVLPEGATTRQPAELQRGDVTRVAAEFPTRNASLWIPAGADFEWRWEFTYTSGEVAETAPQVWRYEDPRFEWESLTDGDLEVAYYDDRGVGESMLQAGLEALEEISPVLGLDALIPMKIYVWANTDDAREVERIESERFEEYVITSGTRVLADLVHIYSPSRWVVRHELTHVLTKLAGEGPYGDLPAWLDEGVATIAEGDWRSRRGGALQYAINNDLVLSLRSMESPSNRPGFVDIFYGQSAAIVTFLITEYGQERMNDLFQAFKQGMSVEDALTAVYDLGRDGIDNAWRASVGLPPREQSVDRSTRIEDEVIGGPQTADSEEASAPAGGQSDAPSQAERQSGQEQQAQSQPMSESAAETDEPEPVEQAAAARSESEIAERVAEIERRQDQRRAGPLFELPDPFPWEYPMIGLAGALVLLSGLLLGRILPPRRNDGRN